MVVSNNRAKLHILFHNANFIALILFLWCYLAAFVVFGGLADAGKRLLATHLVSKDNAKISMPSA
jgi:hypothetical protein